MSMSSLRLKMILWLLLILKLILPKIGLFPKKNQSLQFLQNHYKLDIPHFLCPKPKLKTRHKLKMKNEFNPNNAIALSDKEASITPVSKDPQVSI